MTVIKRYSNRKLYDTEATRYVTLDEIGERIRAGEEINVIDHDSGSDLTAVTLMQVMFEREKRLGGLLPKAIWTSLIQAGNMAVDTLRNGLSTTLRDPSVIEQEIRRRLKILAADGLLAVEELQRLTDLLLSPRFNQAETRETPVSVPGEVDSAVAEDLVKQIDDLERQIASIKAHQSL